MLELRDVSASATAACSRCAASSLGCGRARWWRSSAPTARARRPRCARSPGWCGPAEATIRFEGQSLERVRPAEIVATRHRAGPGGPPHLSAPDRRREPGPRRLSARRARRGAAAREAVARSSRVLERARRQLAATLSGGEQQMLAIGRAMMARPGCCCSTSRRSASRRSWSAGSSRRSSACGHPGVTMLLVEQNARLALAVSDRAYVLERGEVVCAGRSSDVAREERVVRAYLGSDVRARRRPRERA